MSFLLLNQSHESLVKSAGGVFFYSAKKDYILSNGVTPDRSGLGNDVTWNNFAGSASSGLVNVNGLIYRVLDGTDDFGSLVNTSSVDITAAPLAVFVTVKIASSAISGYILFKNSSTSGDSQYGFWYDSINGRILPYLEGSSRVDAPTNSTLQNTWYSVGLIWDGTNVKLFINNVQSGTTGSCSGSLTSKPNLRIGKRENTGNIKANIATVTIYAGTKATAANILKAEKQLSKAYVG